MSKSIFVVVGRLGKSLTTYKILPILETKIYKDIYVFREQKGEIIDGVTYITLEFLAFIRPKLLRKFIRYIAEPIQLVFYAIIYRPSCINGYQLVPKGIYSFITAKLTFRKCIISSIGGIPEIETYFRNKTFWKALNIKILKNASVVTTKGKRVTDYLVKNNVSKEKIFTYNGAIDLARFNTNNIVERDIDVLFVGDFSPLKGPDRALNIVKLILPKKPKIKAVLLGCGTFFDAIKKEIEVNNLSNNVFLEGYIEKPESFFKRSKVLLMPSRSEGLASAMLEAMACGCVPIVSNVGCMNEAAIHNENSFMVEDYTDIITFSEYLLYLLTDEDKRAYFAQNASKLVKHKYSIQEQSQIFRKIIDYIG